MMVVKLDIKADPVPLREDDGGAIRVGPTRVTLEVVLSRYKQGDTPEQIVEAFDTLQLADVYSVIGYYLRHQDEVDSYLAWIDQVEEAVIRRIESQPGYPEWRARVLARRAALVERSG
jgi:uncharacterized protein (DUF433 family)